VNLRVAENLLGDTGVAPATTFRRIQEGLLRFGH
jgi:hypothetical protein